MNISQYVKQNNIFLLLTGLIGLALTFYYVIFPLLQDGLFASMDDVQVVRIDFMVRELRNGQFPVRYIGELGNGGGYMLFNFYSPLVYYLGAIFHFTGFTLVKSTKLVFLLGYFVGSAGMFLLLKKYADRLTAVIGTILFLTAPYVGYDAYIRGALAEFFCFYVDSYFFMELVKSKR